MDIYEIPLNYYKIKVVYSQILVVDLLILFLDVMIFSPLLSSLVIGETQFRTLFKFFSVNIIVFVLAN